MPLANVVKRHPVIWYFVLAYALSWAAIPWQSFFAPGALIAALIVVSLTQGMHGLRELGARLIRWRVGWIWYVIAVGVPLSITLISIAGNLVLGGSAGSFTQLSTWSGIPLAIGMHVLNPTDGPFSEEPSHRGFAQAQLQRRYTRLGATAVMALAVTGWHAPLFVMSSFGLKPFEAITTVAVTFWYGWLFNHTGGSSLLPLIAHGTEGSIATGLIGADATRRAWIYLTVWCLFTVGLLVADRRFWTTQAPAEPDPDVAASSPVRARTV
jgi:membrane protease YdiL (CAAX protease family)